ncbi:MAG: regulatory protein RecX [Hungatella sp.]|nr:regulatory protein RecX [Hungatella sp.]
MQVTSIVPLDKQRSKVFLDEEQVFVLYRGERKRYQIEEGNELSEEQYNRILEEILLKRGKERALYYLKDRDRTEYEIRKKLKEGFYPQQVVDQIINFLTEYHFLDDLDFGRRYIETYGNQRSRKRLEFDLLKKGLKQEQIRILLEDCEVCEDRQIRAFLQKKGYMPESTTPKDKAKLVAALARKGFSFDAVYRNLGVSQEDI